MALVGDTETTGLLKPRLAANELQPQIIELYLAKYDPETFEIIDEFDTFVKPVHPWGEQILLEDPINKLKHIIRITGINDDMLVNAPTFEDIALDVYDFIKDEDSFLGHNAMFDIEILKHNFIRVGGGDLEWDFPNKICTVELSFPLLKRRMKLGELYQMATGVVFEGSHRAKADSQACLDCYKWLIKEGL